MWSFLGFLCQHGVVEVYSRILFILLSLPVVAGRLGSFEHDRVTRVLDQEVDLPLLPHFLCSSQLWQMGAKQQDRSENQTPANVPTCLLFFPQI